MILELGLRFRPTGGENQEEYAAAVTLLGHDVAIIPPALLERAIAEWVRTKRFLPRAAEVIDLAQQIQREDSQASGAGHEQLRKYCDHLNSLAWVKASGKPYIITKLEDGRHALDRAA